jgi:ribulose-5-phosphate 4-epimerase/fuculose-1-phosphate aldolase
MGSALRGAVVAGMFGLAWLTFGGLLRGAVAQTENPNLTDDLVTASHILFDQGVLDGFGHVSVRNPANPERFFMSRARAPGLVEASDIMEFDLDGNQTGGPRGQPVFLELYIHAAVYRARPDVNAVVHSHSPAVIPFSVGPTPLRPVSQTGSFLCAGVPNFDILDSFPEAANLLVTSGEKGKQLAKVLGEAPVALMRGHGDTVVGDDLKQAVYRAVFTELAAKLTAQSLALAGNRPVKYISGKACERELTTGSASGGKEGNQRNWDIWARQAEEHHGN